ncbi:MAG: right-handed parallel beta-helix repeat-containing protein [Candidatus Latescibacterota bacterium]
MRTKVLRESDSPGEEASAAFFVATNGNDRWSGEPAEPNAAKTDGPFATLSRARDAVRQLKAQARDGLKEPVVIMVRGGRYRFDRTLDLTQADSGTSQAPVIYTAYSGEMPVISGGRHITNWKPYKGRILQCELPEAKGGKWRFRQIFCNGKRQTRARWPKFDTNNPVYGGLAFMEGPAEEDSTTAFKYKEGAFRHHWAKPSEAEVNVYPGANWHNDIIPIKAVDEQNRIITLTRSTRRGVDAWPGLRPDPLLPPAASWWTMRSPFCPGNRFCVENVLEELDQPGEWCLDSEDGILYFWPPAESLEKMEVVAPLLSRLVDLCGASYVTISGFAFTETIGGDNQHPPGGEEGYGPMFPIAGLEYCGDAVHLVETERCIVENNSLCGLGGNGIYLEGYNFRSLVRGNEISEVGANGICLLGNRKKHPLNCRVSHNLIHHNGFFDKYSAGVFLGISGGNLIDHNLIRDVPHHAINLGNNGFRRNIVEYNEIHRASQELSETAAINCWMEYGGEQEQSEQRAGHVIRHNLIADLQGSSGKEGEVGGGTCMTIAIFLDNNASNFLVYGNIVIRCPIGISVHGGNGNLIENNIFADCGVAIWHCPYNMPDVWRSQHVNRNIVYFTRPERTRPPGEGGHVMVYGIPYYIDGWSEKEIAQHDYNLIFNVSGVEYPVCCDYSSMAPDWRRKTPFVEWQKMGFDTHSVIADPLFVDPGSDDYRLRPESPALELGFQPIDIKRIGIRKEQLCTGEDRS